MSALDTRFVPNARNEKSRRTFFKIREVIKPNFDSFKKEIIEITDFYNSDNSQIPAWGLRYEVLA